jgi:hypothetical protein
MPLRFHPAMVETSLAQAIEQVEAIVPWCLWVIGPSSQPSDLQQRFVALGQESRLHYLDKVASSPLILEAPATRFTHHPIS